MKRKLPVIEPASLETRIVTVHGERVILDLDLAELYGVTTKRLNEQVKRNTDRFPADFVFSLTANEKAELVANCDHLQRLKYLCCPVQSQEGWAFVTALTTFLKGDWDGIESRRLLPARQLDFNDPLTASIFKEIHYLGNWIVNFDELLDRRQLLNQGVKVIRYKQGITQGRNILVSSTAPLSLLRSMVLGRVRDLNLELSDGDCRDLTERFIDEANEISGDIVLRATKRGRNASELMGVVLSRYLIRHELGTDRRFGSVPIGRSLPTVGRADPMCVCLFTTCGRRGSGLRWMLMEKSAHRAKRRPWPSSILRFWNARRMPRLANRSRYRSV